MILCLDGLIDDGDLAPELGATIASVVGDRDLVAVSYRDKREAEEWLAFNPLPSRPRALITRKGAWLPPPIEDALKPLGTAACDAVAICADSLEISQAHAVGVGAVLVTSSPSGPLPRRQPFTTGPDFVLHGGDDAGGLFDRKKLLGGYVAEVIAAMGAVPRIPAFGTVFASTFVFQNPEDPATPIHVCGRYFRTSDPRHVLHPLSLRLINAKGYPERQEQFISRVIDFWIRANELGPGLLAATPQRADDPPNVVTRAIATVKREGIRPVPGLLRCATDYPKQKDAGSFEARRRNVKGAFTCVEDVRDHTVLVVDDITTSFSTLNECRETLLRAGAARVVPMAIGFHPENLTAGPAVDFPACPDCGGPTRIMHRKKDGGLLVGCADRRVLASGKFHRAIDFQLFYLGAIER